MRHGLIVERGRPGDELMRSELLLVSTRERERVLELSIVRAKPATEAGRHLQAVLV
jgi:hypothetical protein